jgi:hypothetical protein
MKGTPAMGEGFSPTHVVRETAPAFDGPDPGETAVASLAAGLPVEVVDQRGSLSRVRCSNTWEGWTETRLLDSTGPPEEGSGSLRARRPALIVAGAALFGAAVVIAVVLALRSDSGSHRACTAAPLPGHTSVVPVSSCQAFLRLMHSAAGADSAAAVIKAGPAARPGASADETLAFHARSICYGLLSGKRESDIELDYTAAPIPLTTDQARYLIRSAASTICPSVANAVPG